MVSFLKEKNTAEKICERSTEKLWRLLSVRKSQKHRNRNKIYEAEVLKFVGVIDSHAVWLCKCDCGKIVERDGSQMRYGHQKSCGCWAQNADRLNRDITNSCIMLD